MHPVLHLQSDRFVPYQHQPLKQAFVETCLCSLATDHDRAELQVVSYQDDLFGGLEHGQKALGFNGLSGLVNQYVVEGEVVESLVCRGDAGGADDICLRQDFLLSTLPQLLELDLLVEGHLTILVLFGEVLLELGEIPVLQVPHLIMQCQLFQLRTHALPRLRAEPDHFQACLLDPLGKHVDHDVGRRTHQYPLLSGLDEVVDDTGASDSFPCPGRTLDQTERLSECLPDGLFLVKVQFGQSGDFHFQGHFDVQNGLLPGLAKNGVVNVTGNGSVVVEENPQALLHPVVGGWLPNELHFVGILFFGRSLVVRNLQTDLLVARDLDDHTLRNPLVFIGYFQLISQQHARVDLLPRPEHEVCVPFPVLEAKVHSHVVLSVRFLDFPVVLRLLVQQGLENILILLPRLVLQVDRLELLGYSLLSDVEVFQLGVSLPGLFQLYHFLDEELDLLVGGVTLLGDPVDQFLLLDDGLPVLRVPLVLIELLVSHAGRPADEDYTGVVAILDIHVAQHEDV